MPNSRFGYSVKKNSFKGLNIDCVQYSNIIRITYYSYSYSGTILNQNIIRIHIRPNICARIFWKNEYYSYSYSVQNLIPNIICIHIRSKKQYSLTSVVKIYLESKWIFFAGVFFVWSLLHIDLFSFWVFSLVWCFFGSFVWFLSVCSFWFDVW